MSFAQLSYWRLASGVEVDFIIDDVELAIECKATRTLSSQHLRGLRALRDEYPRLKRPLAVCLEPKARKTEDGIWVLPASQFADRLWSGDLF
ncbi:MAG: DUF4143 domain-containing protein [Proteobacteria bacterium]|nr:DUF4143 domain-containing protein [Pseudomonadota bacterium]